MIIPEDLRARTKAAILRITSGQAAMRVPVDPTDPDLVLAEWLRVAAAPVPPAGGEAVHLTAVATLRDDGDGGLKADWLLEGGTSELFAGMLLLVADDDPSLCGEDGSAEVYHRAHVTRLQAEVSALQQRLTIADRRVDDRLAEIAALRQGPCKMIAGDELP